MIPSDCTETATASFLLAGRGCAVPEPQDGHRVCVGAAGSRRGTCEEMRSRAIHADGKDQGCWGKRGISGEKKKQRSKLNDASCPDVLFQNKWGGT